MNNVPLGLVILRYWKSKNILKAESRVQVNIYEFNLMDLSND